MFTEDENKLYPNCVAMTYGDANEMGELNYKCGWGFSAMDCLRFLADHMDAYYDHLEESENAEILKHVRKMECIEYRLEDANFHVFCDYLRDRKYADAHKWILEDYNDLFEVEGK